MTQNNRERLRQAQAAAAKQQRLNRIIGVGAGILVVVLIAVFIGVLVQNQAHQAANNSSAITPPDATADGKAVVISPGVAQQGAPVVELFFDYQCPVCKQYADEILPDVITGPVKDGTANMEFENWAILGPDSTLAAKAALAAGEQNLMWSFIEAFYANQGIENSGYVTDEFLTNIAEDAGIPDIDKWNVDREKPALDDELTRIDTQASDSGFSGTPSFAFRDADGNLTPLTDTQSSQAIIDAINERAKEVKRGNSTTGGQ